VRVCAIALNVIGVLSSGGFLKGDKVASKSLADVISRYVYIYMSIYTQYMYLSIYLYVFTYMYVSIHVYLFVSLPPTSFPPTYRYTVKSTSSVRRRFKHVHTYRSVNINMYIHIHKCIFKSIYVCIYIYISI
jgi:hypothetical protein